MKDVQKKAPDYDVLIVGAGISGIGIAWHLQQKCPDKNFAILEGRDAIGGTWDLFKYPGVRSDSDIYTLGYSFKPWKRDDSIVDGASVREYIEEAAQENGIIPKIRFGVEVEKADWLSDRSCWSLTVRDKATGECTTVTCNFLSTCTGYYSYTDPEAPQFPNQPSFEGDIIHPQFWPENLDYTGKNVVVIGSGATAMTIVPNMAEKAGHVTMLQRTPTYVVSRPKKDWLANLMRRVLPKQLAHNLTRKKNIFMQQEIFKQAKEDPDKFRGRLMKLARKDLPQDVIDAHFSPDYAPWDQRLCLIPESDLFNRLKDGSVSIETGHIETLLPNGIKLKDGSFIEADIIITATGLAMQHMGGITVSIDETPVEFSDCLTYKGLSYSGVPNLVSSWGYFNASWTMRVDMTADYICRLIQQMDKTNSDYCVAEIVQPVDPDLTRPWIEGLSSGYINRKMHLFPRQGASAPWIHPQNFGADMALIQAQDVDDGVMQFMKTNPVSKLKNSSKGKAAKLEAAA